MPEPILHKSVTKPPFWTDFLRLSILGLTFWSRCFWKLQVAKGHPAPTAPREQPVKKSASKSPSRQSRSGAEVANDTSVVEDEAEVLSVYMKNVPSTALASQIEEDFKKFGKIRPDGVAIRTRKDINVCYAFVEYALVLTTLYVLNL